MSYPLAACRPRGGAPSLPVTHCTLTIQPNGLGTGKDAQIASVAPDTNYGAETQGSCRRWSSSDICHFLAQFDVSTLPDDALITAATLTLMSDVRSGSMTAGIYRLLAIWTGAGVTWNSRNGSTAWTAPGATGDGTDRVATPTTTLALGGGGVTKAFTGLAADVQAWVNGTANNGWVIAPTGTPTSVYERFYTCDGGTANGPALYLEYDTTNPPPRVCIIGDSIAATGGWVEPTFLAYAPIGVLINHATAGWGLENTGMSIEVAAAAGDAATIAIVNIGVNDTGTDDAYRAAFQTQLAALRASNPDATVFVMGILNTSGFGGDIATRNTRIATAAANAGCTFWDTDGWIVPATDTTDGVHPNAAGKAKIQTQVLARLPAYVP